LRYRTDSPTAETCTQVLTVLALNDSAFKEVMLICPGLLDNLAPRLEVFREKLLLTLEVGLG
jgi:hypothetical protein